MAAKIISAKDDGASYVVTVHLDTTKTVPGPNNTQVPDPAFVRTWTWGKTPPQGQTVAAYVAAIRAEVKAQVTLLLAQLEPAAPVVLPFEGQAP